MTRYKVAVIGAGTMGQGIAQQCASSGLEVVLIDVSARALDSAGAALELAFTRQVQRGKMEQAAADAALGRIQKATDYALARDCGVFIEAATEDQALKVQVLRAIEAVSLPGALIATNTSSLSITRLSSCLEEPSRFVGMHFFNPVPALPLVEVVRGMRTSDAAFSAAVDFCTMIGKTPVPVRNSPGFLVNRLLCPMINEAILALQESIATADEIDIAMKLGANQPIGPLALADLIGLDTLLAIMRVLQTDTGDQKFRPAGLLVEMVDAGRLGRKTGRGFYSYEQTS